MKPSPLQTETRVVVSGFFSTNLLRLFLSDEEIVPDIFPECFARILGDLLHAAYEFMNHTCFVCSFRFAKKIVYPLASAGREKNYFKFAKTCFTLLFFNVLYIMHSCLHVHVFMLHLDNRFCFVTPCS